MGLKIWFQDDLRNTLAGLTATVVTGDGPLSDYDRGRLSMLASVATALGLDVSELCAGWCYQVPRVNKSPGDIRKDGPAPSPGCCPALSPVGNSILEKSGQVKGASCFEEGYHVR